MIDEQATFEKYGYYSIDLKPKSHKKIVAVCDVCGDIRYLKKGGYSELCRPCACRTDERRKIVSEALTGVPKTAEHRKNISEGLTGIPLTDEHRKSIGDGNKGKIRSDEFRANVSKTHKGKKRTDKTRANMSKSAKGRKSNPLTDEHRQHISASNQGILYEDWIGFATDNPYCNLFNEACRERIRAKYDHRCFACDKPQDENVYKSGKQIALSVHHFDMNKDQGCNGNDWKLVPLCVRCHNKVHSKMWQARIEYLLEYVWDI